MIVPMLSTVLDRAVEQGLRAAALIDRDGNTVGLAGALDEDEARPLAALVMHRLKSADLAERLFAGEIVALALDDRCVAVGIAGRQLFVVAVLDGTSGASNLACDLRAEIEGVLRTQRAMGITPPTGSTGGSGSGPAELPVIELGITVRERGKA